MNRKNLLKKGIFGLGSIIAIPTLVTSCDNDENIDSTACVISSGETAVPFPIRLSIGFVQM